MQLSILALEGATAKARGQCHGESARAAIHELYKIRLALTLERTDLGDEETALALLKRHVPVLASFDPALYEEMQGIAEGADLSLERLVLVNHYTDFRDLCRADLHGGDPGGCSALFTPTPQGPVLGQTWDMHGSAYDHVMLLQVPATDEEPGQLLFTISGCVGMTGINHHGVCMTINNLNSLDAKVGVVWPVLVRRALRESRAAAARDVVLHAPLGSGHHYIVADEHEVFGIETSGAKEKVTQQGADRLHLHTNHPLDDDMAATAHIPDDSTSLVRLQKLQAIDPGRYLSGRAVYDALADVSMALPGPETPHKAATCGAFVMEPRARRVHAGRGPVGATPPVILEVPAHG